MKTSKIIIFVLVSIIWFSCEKKKNEYPYINIFPSTISIQAYSNEKLIFNINIISDEILNNFLITKKFEGEAETVILDSALNIKNLSFQWAYNTPPDITEDLILYFKATNVLGNQAIVGRRLVFYGKKFDEYTGLKIYSDNSGQESAFDLVSLTPVSSSADSSQRDIQEFQADTSYTHLSYKWISPSGCRFVRFNDFDYGNASTATVKAAYEAGIKLTEVANIGLGDIYLVKVLREAPEDVFVVIKVTNLVDKDGRADDYYEIAVKK